MLLNRKLRLREKALPKYKSSYCNLTLVVLKSVAQVKTHISISNYIYIYIEASVHCLTLYLIAPIRVAFLILFSLKVAYLDITSNNFLENQNLQSLISIINLINHVCL